MVSFSLSLSPVIGCDDKSASRPHISFLSDIMGKGQPRETNLKNRNLDPFDASCLSVHNEHFHVIADDNLNDVRECQHGEGCQKQATFGNMDDNTPSFCVKHALRGSVFVKRGYCRYCPDSCCLRTPNSFVRHLLQSLIVYADTQKDAPDPPPMGCLCRRGHCSARSTKCNSR